MKRVSVLLAGLMMMSPLVYAWPRIEFCLLGSFQFSHLSVASLGPSASPEYSPRLAYSLGIGVRYPFSQKFFFEANILYRTKRSELTRFSGVKWNETSYDWRGLAIPLLAYLRYPVSKIQVVVILGVEGNWIFGSRVVDSKNDIIIKPIPGLKSYDLQAVGGVGIRQRRISVEFRYEYGLLNLGRDGESGLVIKSRGFEFLVAFRLL